MAKKKLKKVQQIDNELLDMSKVVDAGGWYTGKKPCPDCGLPRDPSYAEKNPCVVCGTVGLEPLPVEEVPKFDTLSWFAELE